MKISYRNYPALQIYDKSRCRYYVRDSDFMASMEYYLRGKEEKQTLTVDVVKDYLTREIETGERAEYFSDKPIYYLSPAFMAACMHALPQMNKLVVDYEVMKDIHEDCVMILPSPHKSIIEFSTNEEDGQHRLMRITDDDVLSDFYVYDITDFGKNESGFFMTCYLNLYDGDDMVKTSIGRLSAYYIFQLFKKYANVETHLIEAGTKKIMEVDFSPIDCKTPEYRAKNEAGINVIVLDSLWYTNICREEGFMVSGHFRLQPCKDSMGHWTRKIIYIAAYEKHGYHRQARIRSEGN